MRTPEQLVEDVVINNPHLLGHSLGKTLLRPYHSDWIRGTWDVDRRINPFQAARGTYKTTGITEIGIVRHLFLYPNDRIALVRPSYSESVAIIKNVRAFIKSDVMQDLYHAIYGIYPSEKVSKEGSITWDFKETITKEGSLDGFGIGSGITGAHYDIIVFCDIITMKDRISQAKREETIEFMIEVINNVLDPGAKLIHEGTPWHKKDGWSLTPATPEQKWDVFKCGIRTVEEIEELKKGMPDVLFSCNHLLTHVAASDMIFQNPGESVKIERWVNAYAHIDAKYAGDHFGAWTIMCKKTNGRIQAIGELFDDDFSKAVQHNGSGTGVSKVALEFIMECSKRLVRKVWLESNADRGFGKKELERAVELLYKQKKITHRPMIEDYHESMNKDKKIQTYGKRYWESIDWVHSGMRKTTHDDFLEQVVDYMDGQEPNDAPDTMSSLLRQWFHPDDGGSRYAYLYR
jgi:hypothetical protein